MRERDMKVDEVSGYICKYIIYTYITYYTSINHHNSKTHISPQKHNPTQLEALLGESRAGCEALRDDLRQLSLDNQVLKYDV